ncbi:potassium channel family protein [Bradymonas sediminis]|uniref:Uncharacterized protein n=1 Tax=Bradymonas sediminis TaxID=1548548 RepID=A0A2Z4FI69_9DELT|nr:potassium channel family protein [Bradymonas sediminis]AWV88707.1 hypothetical protein DN745_04895 [Bradymonas sediminis]TDP63602.1 ion channel [Bradymonas sediminis]
MATLLAIASVVFGGVVVIIAIGDVMRSTLSTSGDGVISRYVASKVWRVALKGHRRFHSHRLLDAAGPVIVVTIVLVWVALLWFGWLLIFAGTPQAVVHSATQEPAGLIDRAYFVGFTLFTLGVGDFAGGNPWWRMLTTIASINGLSAITLALAYLLPVVEAATAKRQLAQLINVMGDSVAEVIANGWNGKDWAGFENQLQTITPLLLLHGERHLAYPVLHYYHAVEPSAALGPNLLVLDDAITILLECLPEGDQPSASALRATRHAIDICLKRVTRQFVDQADEPPPLPDLSALEGVSLPTIDPKSIEESLGKHSDRRRWLRGHLRGDGWTTSAPR